MYPRKPSVYPGGKKAHKTLLAMYHWTVLMHKYFMLVASRLQCSNYILMTNLFHCCIPDRWHFLSDPSWLRSIRRLAWRSAAGLQGGSSDSRPCCGPQLLIEICLIPAALGPPPGPGSIPGQPGCSQAVGLSRRNQLRSSPPGLLQPESPQSAPV